MFSLPVKVSKDLLLSKNKEEAYMSHYLGINPRYGLFRSPLRIDENPTCSFYRDRKGRLIFKDFADGFHGDFIQVVQKIHNVGYNTAINMIANDFGISSIPHLAKNEARVEYDNTVIEGGNKTAIQCQTIPWDDESLAWWAGFGISEKTLNKYKVFNIQTVFLNGEIFKFRDTSTPIYGYYYGKKDGIEEWKIYFPKKKSHRFLMNTAATQGVKQLPKNGEVVVITKSMKDVMTLHDLGIPAIAPQNENVIITHQQYWALRNRFRYVIVNGDWDRAGQKFMVETRNNFPCIALTFKNKDKYAKDISDYRLKVGEEKTEELIRDLKKCLGKGLYDSQLLRSKNFVYLSPD